MPSAADVVIVGAGIAGCEAAWRCAAAGLEVALVTTSLDTAYVLASDSAELTPPPGSLMAHVAGHGGQVRSWDLHRAVKYALEALPGVLLVQSTVSAVLLDEAGAATGVATWEGVDRRGRLTALCVGSFLRARLTTGLVTEPHGRLSEMAYDDLHDWLARRSFAFVPLSFTGRSPHGDVTYRVDSLALSASERAARADAGAGTGTSAALWRVPRLYAAGVCVEPVLGGVEAASYEVAAEQGMALGAELSAALATR